MTPKSTDEKRFLVSLGRAIKFWRTIEGYNQSNFANAMDTSRSYVSRLETGNVGISIERICHIAQFLEISPETLLSGSPREEELNIIKDLYNEDGLSISKRELSNLFNSSYYDKILTREYFINQLSVLRSDVYTKA